MQNKKSKKHKKMIAYLEGDLNEEESKKFLDKTLQDQESTELMKAHAKFEKDINGIDLEMNTTSQEDLFAAAYSILDSRSDKIEVSSKIKKKRKEKVRNTLENVDKGVKWILSPFEITAMASIVAAIIVVFSVTIEFNEEKKIKDVHVDYSETNEEYFKGRNIQ